MKPDEHVKCLPVRLFVGAALAWPGVWEILQGGQVSRPAFGLALLIGASYALGAILFAAFELVLDRTFGDPA